MRFHLISPDILEVSSKVRSQYSTHVNLKNSTQHTLWLAHVLSETNCPNRSSL